MIFCGAARPIVVNLVNNIAKLCCGNEKSEEKMRWK